MNRKLFLHMEGVTFLKEMNDSNGIKINLFLFTDLLVYAELQPNNNFSIIGQQNLKSEVRFTPFAVEGTEQCMFLLHCGLKTSFFFSTREQQFCLNKNLLL